MDHWATPLEFLMQKTCDGAQGFSSLLSYQMMRVLLVWKPDSEHHLR